jgi:hypothetical protein
MKLAAALAVLLVIAGCPMTPDEQETAPQALSSPIPPGTYEGEVTSTMEACFNGEVAPGGSVNRALVAEFDADGLPVDPVTGQSEAPGLSKTQDLLGFTLTEVTESVTAIENGVRVTCNDTVKGANIPGLGGVTLTGQSVRTYALQQDGTVAYEWSGELAWKPLGNVVNLSMTVNEAGILAP